ncbi:hypothetical protein ACFFX0_16795 [Citricoccus parietis]|uniref:Uncharacterized protein n=1 Tax=Citricoccus parietis TaxID=592307 RepID=A0ABV5G1F4_9MICC
MDRLRAGGPGTGHGVQPPLRGQREPGSRVLGGLPQRVDRDPDRHHARPGRG